MAVLALALGIAAAVLVLLGLLGDAIDRWLTPEDHARTTEPPMWRHPMTRPGQRRSAK